MTEREEMLGMILSKIADEISITSTMQDKAVSSYKAVGKWIGDGVPYDVKIMPQGSINLGTVIKPVDDRDDYDMDLVCLLRNTGDISLKNIKNCVGDRLKENGMYAQKLEKEGKRCWTMQYNEFHMDILPCVPKAGFFEEPDYTEITLTHKNENGIYEPRYSNPYGYHVWFEERMKNILLEEKRRFAIQNKTEIEEVPTYRIHTPLQKAIQLLKRHRDICFLNDDTDAPISIIITTLAAESYRGETNVYEALCNILNNMTDHIENEYGTYWIQNPVMPEENFADKWNSEPGKSRAFFEWVRRAQKELITNPLCINGLDNVAVHFKRYLGDKPVQRAFNSMGEATKKARTNGNLYANGLVGGLSVSAGIPVKNHTFWGE